MVSITPLKMCKPRKCFVAWDAVSRRKKREGPRREAVSGVKAHAAHHICVVIRPAVLVEEDDHKVPVEQREDPKHPHQ